MGCAFVILQQHRFSLDQLRSLCTARERLFFWFQQLLGPRHAFKPSGHISLHSKNAAGRVGRGPRARLPWLGVLRGAQEMDATLLLHAAFAQKCVNGFGLYIYFTIYFYQRFVFLCVSGFLSGDGEFSAHFQMVCFMAFWRNIPTVYSVKHFMHIKKKIHEGLVCQGLYNKTFEFAWCVLCVEWRCFAVMLSLHSREVCARPINFPSVQC